MQLRLSQKGLALVGLLVICELVFVVNFHNLLESAEEESRREERAKLLSSRMTNVLGNAYETARLIKSYVINRKKEDLNRIDELISDTPKSIAFLKNNLDKRDLDNFSYIEDGFNEITSVLKEVQAIIARADTAEILSSVDKFNKRIDPVFKKTLPHLTKLRESLEEQARESTSEQRKVRKRTAQMLYLSVGVNVLMAVLLGVFFMKGITSRIELLVENTRRLSQGKPLNEPVTGSDEIAVLDHVFHEMADELARKERALTEYAADVKASEARWRVILESMPVGIIVLTQLGQIEMINSTTEQMFCYEQADLTGAQLGTLFPKAAEFSRSTVSEESLDGVYPRYLRRIGELVASRKSGENFPVEFSLEEFESSDGPRLLAIVLDVTERQEIQEMRRAFVAMISHDLRTPLTGVQGFLELLSMGAIEPDLINEKSKLSFRSVQRLISLINDLLELEKLESGQQALDVAPVSAGVILDQALDAVTDFADQHKVELDVPISDKEVIADGSRIVRVLVNLLSNAIKFSPEHGLVEVTVTPKDDVDLEFRVIDQGPGIPENMRELIFERFKQVNKTDATTKGGTGLGLAICKSIISQHNGKIGIDSELGQGSQFWFRIPLSNGSERKAES